MQDKAKTRQRILESARSEEWSPLATALLAALDASYAEAACLRGKLAIAEHMMRRAEGNEARLRIARDGWMEAAVQRTSERDEALQKLDLLQSNSSDVDPSGAHNPEAKDCDCHPLMRDCKAWSCPRT